jgi:CelD/BcsL family acetyltransferase involved in cellulose biosynthesis
LDVDIRIYRGPRGLTELSGLWQGLVDSMADRNLVHAYEWHRSLLESLEPHPEAALFVGVWLAGSLGAILPLRPARPLGRVGRRGLEVPANPHVPYTDFVVSGPARLRAAMPAVLRRLAAEPDLPWDYLALRRTPRDSGAGRCLRDLPGFTIRSTPAGSADCLSVRSQDALFGSLTSHFRNNLRRAHKRAEALGGISYHTARDRQGCEALFQEFLAVEASGWKGEDGTRSAIALDDRLRSFYTMLMRRFADRGQCRIDVVRHDTRPIAAAFQLVVDQTIYGLKIGFDESHAHIAPGNLLHSHIFRSACYDPLITTYDMTSDATWHAQWKPGAVELVDIVVLRPGLRGAVADAEERTREHARHLRQRIVRRWIVTERGRRRLVWRRGPPREARR